MAASQVSYSGELPLPGRLPRAGAFGSSGTIAATSNPRFELGALGGHLLGGQAPAQRERRATGNQYLEHRGFPLENRIPA